MGRPPLNVVETKVRLTAVARARIVALVGTQKMAAFIRKAIDNELDREEAISEAKAAQPPLRRAAKRKPDA